MSVNKFCLNAELLCMAALSSRNAYAGFHRAERFRNLTGFSEAFLLRSDDYDVLVYTGSNDWLDWLINFTIAPPVPYLGGLCHPGFAVAHSTIWRTIRKRIDPLKPLLITGHSLGGALAEKTAAALEMHLDDLHLITFGKPNVHINGCCADISHLKTELSVVHGSDIVARVPRILYRPTSTQDQLYFDNDGNAHLNPSRELKLADWRRQDIFKDHSMNGYYSRVLQYLGMI